MEEEKTVHYLIDHENVANHFQGILPLRRNADVIIFYTNAASHLSLKFLEEVSAASGSIRAILCKAGRNALDFQLVTVLGYMIHAQPQGEFIIYSNDQGYDPVCEFWSAQQISVKRVRLTAGEQKPTPKEMASSEQSEYDKIRNALKKAFPEPYTEYIKPVAAIIQQCGKNNLSKIYLAFLSQFGRAEGLALYQALRAHIRAACKNLP